MVLSQGHLFHLKPDYYSNYYIKLIILNEEITLNLYFKQNNASDNVDLWWKIETFVSKKNDPQGSSFFIQIFSAIKQPLQFNTFEKSKWIDDQSLWTSFFPIDLTSNKDSVVNGKTFRKSIMNRYEFVFTSDSSMDGDFYEVKGYANESNYIQPESDERTAFQRRVRQLIRKDDFSVQEYEAEVSEDNETSWVFVEFKNFVETLPSYMKFASKK